MTEVFDRTHSFDNTIPLTLVVVVVAAAVAGGGGVVIGPWAAEWFGVGLEKCYV
mgnify:CR=1 FL=1